jgi:hypothetical protein
MVASSMRAITMRCIGLAGDLADDLDDLADVFRPAVDQVHRLDRLGHGLGAGFGFLLRGLGQRVGVGGIAGDGVDGIGQAVDGGIHLLDGGAQRLGADRHAVGALGNGGRGVGKAVGRGHHFADHLAQVGDHLADAAGQVVQRLAALDHDLAGQVAPGGALHRFQQAPDLGAVSLGLGCHRHLQMHLLGNVDCIFDYFIWLAIQIHNRIISSLNPDCFSVIAETFITAAVKLATIQFLPEAFIFRTIGIFSFAKEVVMLAFNIVDGITHDIKEIIISAKHVSLHVEFNRRLGLGDGADLAFVLGVAHLVRRHVGGELDHLERRAVGVEDRVVGGVQPQFAAALGHPLVLAGLELAGAELVPEMRVGFGLDVVRIAEHAVMLALDLRQRITDGRQEIVVGVQDRAVEGELDDGLGLADGIDFPFELGGLELALCDVGGKLDHFVRLAVGVDDRIVGCVDPDLPAILADTLVLAVVELAGRQLGPELLVGGAARIARFAEHRVMLALDLAQRIADRLEEVIVGMQDDAVQTKLDHGLHAIQCGIYSLKLQNLRVGGLVGSVHKGSYYYQDE